MICHRRLRLVNQPVAMHIAQPLKLAAHSDGKEREFEGKVYIADVEDREKGDENEARPYFRVTVALPSVSRHRLYATRCILLPLPSVCICMRICVRCIGHIYIWLEGGAGLA